MSTLTHLSAPPRDPGAGAPPGLLLLHGYGSNKEDLMGLSPYLDPRLHIISAEAPYTLGPGMYAWYELQPLPGGDFRIDERQAQESMGLLRRFVAEIIEMYGLDPARLFVGGFSQGAINACALLLEQPESVAGAVLMSGRWPEGVEPAAEERLEGKPVIAVHGRHDPVIPIRYGHALREQLAALPVRLSYHEYPMAHNVSAESLATVTRWLSEELDGQSP